MITILKFRVFDKELEKIFYQNETLAQMHQTLKEISPTYVPLEIKLAEIKMETQAQSTLRALSVLKQQDEFLNNQSHEKL